MSYRSMVGRVTYDAFLQFVLCRVVSIEVANLDMNSLWDVIGRLGLVGVQVRDHVTKNGPRSGAA